MSSILIADNDRGVRGLLAAWLADAGHVCAISDAAGALACLHEHDPGVALVGVASAGDSGTWILRALKTGRSAVAAVAVTPNPGLEVLGETRRLGAFECLPWPSSRATVIEAVQRALDWQAAAAEAVQRRARLLQDVQHGHARLMRAVQDADSDTAQAILLAALEAQSPKMFEHAQRVARSSAALASAMGVAPDTARAIRVAGLLHDAGKIAMPAALLQSGEPLGDDEIGIIQSHATLGEQLLASVSGLASAACLVAAVHERFDGLGYPAGRAGGQVPLGARIIAVADAYDALISRRLYGDPLTHEAANAELLRDAGTRFDPDVVRAWIDLGDRARC